MRANDHLRRRPGLASTRLVRTLVAGLVLLSAHACSDDDDSTDMTAGNDAAGGSGGTQSGGGVGGTDAAGGSSGDDIEDGGDLSPPDEEDPTCDPLGQGHAESCLS